MSRKEILKLKLSEPVRYDGKEITELDLSGYEMLTLKDLTEIYAAYEAFGGGSVIMQESDLRFAQCAAAVWPDFRWRPWTSSGPGMPYV